MKTKSIITIALIGIVSLTALTANAQSEPAIKIVPAVNEGIFKLIYAYDSHEPVQVKFFNEFGVLAVDKIAPKEFQNGFSKKFDTRKMEGGDFWVKISSADLSVTYRMVESKKGKSYQPVLESSTHESVLTALNN